MKTSRRFTWVGSNLDAHFLAGSHLSAIIDRGGCDGSQSLTGEERGSGGKKDGVEVHIEGGCN
jgi:hypothetical protein